MAAAYQIFTQPSQQALDTAANVLSGATLTFTLTGTSTATNAFTSQTLLTPLANPLAADSAGVWPTVFLDPTIFYRVVLKTAAGAVLKTWDPANENVLNQALIGLTLNPRTTSEIAAPVTPTNYVWPESDLRRYGVTDNDTDQTTQIVAAFAAFGTTWDGDLYIPARVRFNTMTVLAALPYKTRLYFTNIFQSGSGYRQQITGVMSRPFDANTDTSFEIIDPHFPNIDINNPRTAGTTSAGLGLCGFTWGRGFFSNGTNGPRPLWQTNWTKAPVRTAEYGGAGLGCFISRVRSPERAGNYEFWFNGIVVAIGDFIHATNGWVYRAVTAGTSTVSPSHASGNATVGGITWAFESTWTPFKTNFYYDELGRVGNDPCDTGITQEWAQNPEDAENFTVRYTANGISKNILTRYRVTDGAAALINMPFWEYSNASGMRLFDAGATHLLARADNTNICLQFGETGQVTTTATNADTTPSVAGISRIVLSNSGATSITNFDTFTPTQRFSLYATNGNTTLVNSGVLNMKGAINVVLANTNIMWFQRDPSNAGWVEESRNF